MAILKADLCTRTCASKSGIAQNYALFELDLHLIRTAIGWGKGRDKRGRTGKGGGCRGIRVRKVGLPANCIMKKGVNIAIRPLTI